MAERKKVVKYRKPFHINIGVVVFGFIFIYIVFYIFSYFTSEHIAVYEVGQGTIAENNTYYGLVLREEKIISSSYSGYINYYLRDAAKTSYNNLVYSVDETGNVAEKISSSASQEAELDSEDYLALKDKISGFSNAYQSTSFYQVYTFKEELEAQLMETMNQKALNSLGDYTSYAQTNQTFHLVNATEPGIVVYYTDGYENVTMDSFSPEMMNALNYNKVSLKQNAEVQAGEPAYKLITSENWNIVFPVSDSTYERLAAKNVVNIQFKKDGISCWVNYEFQKIGDNYYMILSLKDHMVRFCGDRFVEIELLIDEESGLKLPNSAITEKEFFTVPKEYFSKGGNSNSNGLLVEQPAESASAVMVFVETTLYYETDDVYYIEKDELIQAGTVIRKPDSNETYTIRDTETLSGVYNVNKGFAVFKQIDVLYQNDEYTIVRMGTSYGISLYDHIALEGNKVEEDDLIY